jgi:hypothetical protein
LQRRIGIVALLVAIIGLVAGLYLATSSSAINRNSNMLTLRGTIQPGVEAGCVILQLSDGTQYLLLDWSSFPLAGTEVTVTGYVEANVASYCMQGKEAIHVVSISISNGSFSSSVGYGTVGTATASNATVIAGSTAQSTTVSGQSVKANGYVISVVESPRCYPQCGMPSFMLTYLLVGPGPDCVGSMVCNRLPREYRLLNMDGSPFWLTAPNGTFAIVIGIQVTPSSWNCESLYHPKICFSGDMYIQSITYSSTVESTFSSSAGNSMPGSGTSALPVGGFDSLSILGGLVAGLIVLGVARHPSRSALL